MVADSQKSVNRHRLSSYYCGIVIISVPWIDFRNRVSYICYNMDIIVQVQVEQPNFNNSTKLIDIRWFLEIM